jgi:hypothetical protein
MSPGFQVTRLSSFQAGTPPFPSTDVVPKRTFGPGWPMNSIVAVCLSRSTSTPPVICP